MTDEPTIVNDNSARADGLNKCPYCGSSDISTQPGTGRLVCNYCRAVFDPPAPMQVSVPTGAPSAPEAVAAAVAAGTAAGAPTVTGTAGGTQEVRYSGAADIDPNASTQVTIKCQGCGAEVVVDTSETMYARCHWCRQYLSLENQVPNGAVPDILLPFYLSKEQARASIDQFVKKRTFFANRRFKAEFTSENVTGVYLPYFVVDANTHNTLSGTAGHVARTYKVGVGKDEETRYDIDVYNIGRDFDLAVSGLTIEASGDKRNVSSANNTNNIINSIMPFDVQNAIPYNGNYLKGFTSERRDTNIDDIKGLATTQIQDITRYQADTTTTSYDAGVRWEKEDDNTKGITWRSAYLPVWLYSYLEAKNNGAHVLHYVAVNARTGETMGSVPVDKKRLALVAAIIEIIAIPIGILFMLFGW